MRDSPSVEEAQMLRAVRRGTFEALWLFALSQLVLAGLVVIGLRMWMELS